MHIIYICYSSLNVSLMFESALRNRIIESLTLQGFNVNGHVSPILSDKESFKKIHEHSRKEQIILQKDFILKNLETASKYFINGRDINPNEIELELRIANEGSEEHTLFRWWNLVWWSVPYQRAYGRQMRFLLWDKTHNAPFGLIGLQSPVLKMAVRDDFLQIPKSTLDIWVNKSMQAQRLGALPPYNQILGGKMVALSLTANELRNAYKEKYKNVETILEKRVIDPDLLFLTTTSAFGRSSIYNRLKFNGELVAESLGYTKGSGTFHIPQELYSDILKYLSSNGINIGTTFGCGPSRKLKILYQAFSKLEIGRYTYHNIQREFFLFPLVDNLKEVISKNEKPHFFERNLSDLNVYWRQRWCIPRAERFSDWRNFEKERFLEELKFDILNHAMNP